MQETNRSLEAFQIGNHGRPLPLLSPTGPQIEMQVLTGTWSECMDTWDVFEGAKEKLGRGIVYEEGPVRYVHGRCEGKR